MVRGKHCWRPIAVMGVLDYLGHCMYFYPSQRNFTFTGNLLIIVGILPAGLIPKTTQNYKPLWVPNPKIPIDFRDKPNPTHTRGFFRVIPLGTHEYPP